MPHLAEGLTATPRYGEGGDVNMPISDGRMGWYRWMSHPQKPKGLDSRPSVSPDRLTHSLVLHVSDRVQDRIALFGPLWYARAPDTTKHLYRLF